MTAFKNKAKDWVREQICEHTKRLIVWLISILGLPTVLLILKDWLKAEQSFTLPGWSWVLLLLAVSSLPILLYIEIKKAAGRRVRYLTEYNDIELAIIDWLKERKYSSSRAMRRPSDPLLRIRYDSIDAQCKLKPGSAKKHLSDVVKKCGWVDILREGDQTVVLDFRPSVSISHSASGQTLRE